MSDKDDGFDIDLGKGASNMESITNTPFAVGKMCFTVFGTMFKLIGVILSAIFSQK